MMSVSQRQLQSKIDNGLRDSFQRLTYALGGDSADSLERVRRDIAKYVAEAIHEAVSEDAQ